MDKTDFSIVFLSEGLRLKLLDELKLDVCMKEMNIVYIVHHCNGISFKAVILVHFNFTCELNFLN